MHRDSIKYYDQRHGGAFDRGRADSWYSRERNPHMFTGATYASLQISQADMTPQQVDDYLAGYEWNERHGGKKNYG